MILKKARAFRLIYCKMDKPKIVILSDSVALPRNTSNGSVQWEDTYIHKLRIGYHQYEVINISIGGASIKDLRNQVNYYKILKPEIVVLHCGIVDAAPRAFGRIEIELIKKMKLFRFTKPFVSFLRKYRAHHYASLRKFEKTLNEIKKEFAAQRFIGVGIVPSQPGYEKRLPGITDFIANYNEVLRSNTEYVSLEQMPLNGVLEDYHHINKIGQAFIYEQVTRILNKR